MQYFFLEQEKRPWVSTLGTSPQGPQDLAGFNAFLEEALSGHEGVDRRALQRFCRQMSRHPPEIRQRDGIVGFRPPQRLPTQPSPQKWANVVYDEKVLYPGFQDAVRLRSSQPCVVSWHNSPFSNWYPGQFYAPVPPHSQWHGTGLLVPHSEMALMLWKIHLATGKPFDTVVQEMVARFQRPLTAVGAGEAKSEATQLSRGGRSAKKWFSNRAGVSVLVNFAKFVQQPEILRTLVETWPCDLIEAAPNDRDWGIGMSSAQLFQLIRQHGNRLPPLSGGNILGVSLEVVRELLIRTAPWHDSLRTDTSTAHLRESLSAVHVASHPQVLQQAIALLS